MAALPGVGVVLNQLLPLPEGVSLMPVYQRDLLQKLLLDGTLLLEDEFSHAARRSLYQSLPGIGLVHNATHASTSHDMHTEPNKYTVLTPCLHRLDL